MTFLKRYSMYRQPIFSKEWDAFSPRPHVEAGFTSSGSALEIPGISLVYLVNKSSAVPGDKLIFTAWILNATTETLEDLTLVMRSFTNSRLDRLSYETQPDEKLLKGRVLGPGRSLQYSFTYEVTPADTEEPGHLLSALGARATSELLGTLLSECDSIVAV